MRRYASQGLFWLEGLLQRDIYLAEAGTIKNPYVLKTMEKDRKLFMPLRDYKGYLSDVIEACDKIMEYSQGLTLEGVRPKSGCFE